MESDACPPIRPAIQVDPRVLQRFPSLKLAVVLVENFPQDRGPGEWDAELRKTEESVRTILSTETLTSHPVIREWREAYRSIPHRLQTVIPSS
jgi:DNA/RNA-binding domain of Phe-tRNA-synthetase-like protein